MQKDFIKNSIRAFLETKKPKIFDFKDLRLDESC